MLPGHVWVYVLSFNVSLVHASLQPFNRLWYTSKMECQNREKNHLDGKHLIRQTIIEPTEDRYDDQR